MVIVPAAGGDNFVCHNGVPSTQRNYAPCAIQGTEEKRRKRDGEVRK